MKWIFRDIKQALLALKRGETWLALALLAGFGFLTYTVSLFAFKTDSVLRHLHHTMAACRELSNGPIIFLFCGIVFFALSVVVSFGEFHRYFECRDHRGHVEARRALISGIAWSAVAITISAGALLFFNTYCR